MLGMIKVAAAIEATGRKKLIIAGISLEVCAAFPAITAIGKGYDAYVAVDASGTFSDTKREAGLLRMQQAGVIGLRHPDGRDPEGQRAAGSSRGLRRARYALGDPRRPNLHGLRQAKRGGADEPALTGVPALIWPAIRLAEEIGQRKLSGSFTSQNRNAGQGIKPVPSESA